MDHAQHWHHDILVPVCGSHRTSIALVAKPEIYADFS